MWRYPISDDTMWPIASPIVAVTYKKGSHSHGRTTLQIFTKDFEVQVWPGCDQCKNNLQSIICFFRDTDAESESLRTSVSSVPSVIVVETHCSFGTTAINRTTFPVTRWRKLISFFINSSSEYIFCITHPRVWSCSIYEQKTLNCFRKINLGWSPFMRNAGMEVKMGIGKILIFKVWIFSWYNVMFNPLNVK